MANFYDVAPQPGFHPETGFCLACLIEGTRKWRSNLGKVSKEAVQWQQREQGPSIGTLILHMIESEVYWLENFAAGRRVSASDSKLFMSKDIRQYGGKWPLPYDQPLEWYFDLQDQYRSRSWDAIRDIDPKTTFQRKDFSCTLRWVMSHILQHDAYHGGQAVLMHEQFKAARRTARAKKLAV